MAVYGRAGSTLTDELNRLANGGSTYPDKSAYLADQGAASKWANVNPPMAVQGALNKKYGITDPKLYLAITGICNALAGTTGLDAVTALRQVAS
jgi:hypothetical protein